MCTGLVGVSEFINLCDELRVAFEHLGKSWSFFKVAVGDFILKIELTKRGFAANGTNTLEEFVDEVFRKYVCQCWVGVGRCGCWYLVCAPACVALWVDAVLQ